MEWSIWGVLAVMAKTLGYGGSLAAVGSAMFVGLFAPPEALAHSARRFGVMAGLVGVVASLAFLLVQAGYLVDDGWRGMVDPFVVGLVVDGPLGTSTAARIVGLALVMLAMAMPSFLLPLAALGALFVAASFSLSGHATAEPRLVLSLLIAIHVLGLSFWIGAFWPLYKAVDRLALDEAAQLAHRFGTMAMVVVPVLIVAGALFTFLRVNPLTALVGSNYGFALAAKLVLVSGLLLLALANRYRLVPGMQAGTSASGIALKRSIRWEAAAVATILVLTAVLTTITPIPGSTH